MLKYGLNNFYMALFKSNFFNQEGGQAIKEYANLASFPMPGDGKYFYKALDTQLVFIWNTTTNKYEQTWTSGNLSDSTIVKLVVNTNGQTQFSIGVAVKNDNRNTLIINGATYNMFSDFEVDSTDNTKINYKGSRPLETTDEIVLTYYK